MMARASRRTSLLEPLTDSPASSSPAHPNTARQTLIQFDSNGDLRSTQEASLSPLNRLSNSKSIFGVDQLWEKELTKLKIMQEKEEALRGRQDAAQAKTKGKKDKGKGKAIDSTTASPHGPEQNLSAVSSSFPSVSPTKRASDRPPTLYFTPDEVDPPRLPVVAGNSLRKGRLGVRDLIESSDEGSDEEEVAKRTVDRGEGKLTVREEESDDSDDDIPLSQVVPVIKKEESLEEDEDVPLSSLARSPVKIDSARLIINTSQNGGVEGDDDIPLGLRQSKSPHLQPQDEDDLPLGHRHSSAAYRQTLAAEQCRMTAEWWSRELGARQGFGPYASMGQPFPLSPMWGGAPSHLGFPGYPTAPSAYGGMMGYVQPPIVPSPGPEKAIDSWRKEVAVAPAGVGSAAGGTASVA